MPRISEASSGPVEQISEIDLRALGAALRRRLGIIVLAPLFACVLIAVLVNLVAPRYTAETQVLLENQETFFTRPDRVNLQPDQPSQLDPEAVASQVQLIGSRDLARRAIKELGLEGDPEFDPLARGMNPLKSVLVLLGLARDPTQESRDARIVTAFLDKLVVYSPSKTRVISIDFTSRDADLAARAANTVAALYLKEQSAAKRLTAKNAADALASQIADLRAKLVKADDAREQYRLQSGLLAGTNNMTISGQQLADINTDLSKARTAQADAQAKASMIRDLLRNGDAANVPDVINNDIVRRVSDQRISAQAELALESRTLLPGHPRIKALQAQVSEYDLALKTAAKQAAITLENEAKIAGTRVGNLETVLAQQKTLVGTANVDQVHLAALERTAQGYRDQLDSSTTKYQEALARQSSDATPADARVIQRATEPQEPSFPKKLPFIIFGTIATLVFALGFIVAAELLSGRAAVAEEPAVVVAPDRGRHAEPGRPADSPKGPFPARPSRAAAAHAKSMAGGPIADAAPRDDDLVFAPVDRRETEEKPSAAAAGGLVAGGVVGSLVERIRAFGRSAVASPPDDEPRGETAGDADGVGWDSGPPNASESKPKLENLGEDAERSDPDTLSELIVAAHVPGRGLHIVGTSLGSESDAVAILIHLGRTLSGKGRAIMVDLNRAPANLAPLVQPNGDGRGKIIGMNGLSELLAGGVSFADVIHRDHASRLHFIPTGRQEADFHDFDLILDALSETYDFVVLLTPAYPQSEIAKIMAPYADFVVLTAATETDLAIIASLEQELIEAGAREVLVAGRATQTLRRDVA